MNQLLAIPFILNLQIRLWQTNQVTSLKFWKLGPMWSVFILAGI